MEKKIVLVCGSRTFRNRILMFDTILKFKQEWMNRYEILLRHGGAKGADRMAKSIFETLGLNTEKAYKPKYRFKYDPDAPKERNIEMLETEPIPFIVLAFFNRRRTPGTAHCVDNAKERGIQVMEFGLK